MALSIPLAPIQSTVNTRLLPPPTFSSHIGTALLIAFLLQNCLQLRLEVLYIFRAWTVFRIISWNQPELPRAGQLPSELNAVTKDN